MVYWYIYFFKNSSRGIHEKINICEFLKIRYIPIPITREINDAKPYKRLLLSKPKINAHYSFVAQNQRYQGTAIPPAFPVCTTMPLKLPLYKLGIPHLSWVATL